MKVILLHYFIIFFIPYQIFQFWHQKQKKSVIELSGVLIFLSSIIWSFNQLWNTYNYEVLIFWMLVGIIIIFFIFQYYQRKGSILILRTIYTSLLVVLVICSCYELLFDINMHILLESNYLFHLPVLFGLFIGGFFFFEQLIEKIIDDEVIEFFLGRVKVWQVGLVLIFLIMKTITILIILNKSNHAMMITYLFLATTLAEIVFYFITIHYIAKMYHFSVFKYRHKILNEMYDLQLIHFEQLEHKSREIRRLSHDIHNHKIILEELVINQEYDQALKYLSRFDEDSKYSEDTLQVTEHRVLNALCQQKQLICHENEISLDLDFSISSTIAIDDFDLCIIFGNLFDNAIEATKKCSNNQRYIRCQVREKNLNLVITIKNHFEGQLKKDKEYLITSKENKILHGIGLSNVSNAVSKYQGDFRYHEKDKMFIVQIRMPLQKK